MQSSLQMWKNKLSVAVIAGFQAGVLIAGDSACTHSVKIACTLKNLGSGLCMADISMGMLLQTTF